MVKHVWSILCQKSLVDSTTNNITLVDVLESLEVDVSKLPEKEDTEAFSIPIEYQLVSFWKKNEKEDQESIEVRVSLNDPKGEELNKLEKDISFPKERQRVRDINKIRGMTLNTEGVYSFKVFVKREKEYQLVAEIPLEVKFRESSKK